MPHENTHTSRDTQSKHHSNIRGTTIADACMLRIFPHTLSFTSENDNLLIDLLTYYSLSLQRRDTPILQ